MSLLEWNGRISECIKTKDSLNVTHSWWCLLISVEGQYKQQYIPSTVTVPVKMIDIVTRVETIYMFVAGYAG